MGWLCRLIHQFLPEAAAGVALPPIDWWVRRHVAHCPECARLWRQHERLTFWLQQASAERATPPDDLWERIASRLASRGLFAPQPSRQMAIIPSWQKAMAVAALGLVALGAWLWWRGAPSSPPTITIAPPDAFVTAVLHQHIAVTAPSPFNNPTFTAGMIAGGEAR
ncbi:MAG: hypothetical protein LKKZDAJK_000199 [Candidatus Fervidibacter sp.]